MSDLESLLEPTDANPDVSLDSGGDACIFRRGECRRGFAGMSECTFEPGACFYFGTESTGTDKMQTPLMPDAARPVVASQATLPAPSVTPAAPVVPVASQPITGTPMVGTPDTAAGELSKLVPANGQGGMTTVLLALLAVAGGGAAWKFYSQHSKEKHEQKMKELELKASQPSDQHPSCKADSAAIHENLRKLADSTSATSSAVTAVSQRVDKLEAKTSIEVPDLSDDLSTLKSRVKKLEKAARRDGEKA